MPSITTYYNELAAKEARERDAQARDKRGQLISSVKGARGAPQGEGIIGKVRQMNSYSPEAVVGEMLAQMFISLSRLFDAACGTNYLWRRLEYKALCWLELQTQTNLLYQADGYGVYPKIYPRNAKGEVDKSADPIIDPKKITKELVEANNYVVPPSTGFWNILTREIGHDFVTAVDDHIEAMLGSQKGNSHKNDVDPNAANLMLNNKPTFRPPHT